MLSKSPTATEGEPLMAPPVLAAAPVAIEATVESTDVATPVERFTVLRSTWTAAADGLFAGSQITLNPVIVPAKGTRNSPFFVPLLMFAPLPESATCIGYVDFAAIVPTVGLVPLAPLTTVKVVVVASVKVIV
jgi:hypothetical protein